MQQTITESPVRAKGRRPYALVVPDPPPDEIDARVDWSVWYLTDEEDMGQSLEQADGVEEMMSSVKVLVEERAWSDVYCSFDNCFAWVEAEPLVRVSPDVYLVDGPVPKPPPKSWQTWLPGHRPPRWALEIVSDDWRKDYDENPPKYAQLGARELVVFDAHAEALGSNGDGGPVPPVRVPLQVYRRGADGALVRVYRGNGPAHSEELDVWLVVRRDGGVPHLRLARGPAGIDLVPTALEKSRAAEARAAEAEERLRALEEKLRGLSK